MTEYNAWAGMDHFLYFDEDQDLNEDQMADYSPVEAVHIIDLIERGMLYSGEVFSHKGYHHTMALRDGEWSGSMWDGPTGDERCYVSEFNEWNY